MTLIHYKPVTSSLRHKVLVLKTFNQLQKNESQIQGDITSLKYQLKAAEKTSHAGQKLDAAKRQKNPNLEAQNLETNARQKAPAIPARPLSGGALHSAFTELKYRTSNSYNPKIKFKKTPPIKKLLKGLSAVGGRNNRGKATLITQGGGHKKLYRIVDFKRRAFDQPAIVLRKEYDPNRSSFIASILYKNTGALSYILAPVNLMIGQSVISSLNTVPLEPGNTTLLANIPEGSFIHNLEIRPGQGGKLVRSAGNYAQLLKKEFTDRQGLATPDQASSHEVVAGQADKPQDLADPKGPAKGRNAGRALVKLRSGALMYLPLTCLATFGSLSNPDHQNEKFGKAGRSIWLNRRPHVRGVAKNPVDHPHGGGQGKTSGGRPSVTPKGWPTKGRKTRKRLNPFVQHAVK